MARITRFLGDYFFLSNFWHVNIKWDGHIYRSVEHAYQASKTNDPKEKKRIRDMPSANRAKMAGNGVKLREDWEEVKVGIMKKLVRRKFNDKHKDLQNMLLDTGDAELIEGNWERYFLGSMSRRRSKLAR